MRHVFCGTDSNIAQFFDRFHDEQLIVNISFVVLKKPDKRRSNVFINSNYMVVHYPKHL